MNKNIGNVIEVLKKNKKRIIRGTLIFGVVVIGLGVTGTMVLYNRAKSNINYTEEQAKEIALKLIPGEIVRIDRDLELEDLTFEYDIKIKDENNMLREVTVDAGLGIITDSDYND